MLRVANQVIVFLIELIMLGAFAWFGFQKANGQFSKFALAVILPLVGIVLWGYFAAPRSEHRLSMPYLAIFRLVMFLLASYLLYICGKTKFALILALLSAATQVGSFFFEE